MKSTTTENLPNNNYTAVTTFDAIENIENKENVEGRLVSAQAIEDTASYAISVDIMDSYSINEEPERAIQIDVSPKTLEGTFIYIIVITCFFISGLLASDDPWKHLAFFDGFAEPPATQSLLFFRTYSVYPTCADERYQIWRLLSNQLVHGGLLHYLPNILGIAIYGSLYSRISKKEPYLVICLGVVIGNLTMAWVNPYVSVVGCSGGVFSLLGSLLALVLKKEFSREEDIGFVYICLFGQFAGEVVMMLFYTEMQSYIIHFGGFIAGFLHVTTLVDLNNITFIRYENQSTISYIMMISKYVAFCLVNFGFLYLYWSYITEMQPSPHFNMQPYDENGDNIVACCELVVKSNYGSYQESTNCYYSL